MNGFALLADHDTSLTSASAMCESCGLYKKSKSNKIPAFGKGKKKILIVGTAPEDGKNIGAQQKFIQQQLAACDIIMLEDCILTNALKCPRELEITETQIEACRVELWKTIDEYKPSLIILLGKFPLYSFLRDRYTKLGEFSKWDGLLFPDRKAKAWVQVLEDPRILDMDKKKHPVLIRLFRNRLEKALSFLKEPFPEHVNEREQVKILYTEEEQLAWCEQTWEKAQEKPLIFSFDYETTGIKPHADGHKIACMSICVEPNQAIVLPIVVSKEGPDEKTSPKVLKWVKKFLTSDRFLKTAHNIAFEDHWSRNILQIQVFPWYWCTMQTAHMIDNRTGFTGLKFQAFINFGLLPYTGKVDQFISQKRDGDDSDNALNYVFDAPEYELFIYCGIDSLVQYRLLLMQRSIIGEQLSA